MSDIKLPLWNKDETDVLPEYQLSFGHAICQADINEEAVHVLAKHLMLGSLEHVGPLDVERLPMHSLVGCRMLCTEDATHLVVARNGAYSAVFGPHRLFLNNQLWIKWNSRYRGIMAIVTRYDVAESSYRVFESGRRIVSAWSNGGQIKCLEDPSIDVYFSGMRLFSDPGRRMQLSEAVASMLSNDMTIHDESGTVRLTGAFTHQPIMDVKHFVFRRNPDGPSRIVKRVLGLL